MEESFGIMGKALYLVMVDNLLADEVLEALTLGPLGLARDDLGLVLGQHAGTFLALLVRQRHLVDEEDHLGDALTFLLANVLLETHDIATLYQPIIFYLYITVYIIDPFGQIAT